MTPLALAWRLLLALALVFNGSGLAMASAAVAPAEDAKPAMAACHDMAGMDHEAGPDSQAAAATAKAPQAAPDDCCAGGRCGCACVHPPVLATLVPRLPHLRPVAPAMVVPSLAVTRDVPTSLFRPPIG